MAFPLPTAAPLTILSDFSEPIELRKIPIGLLRLSICPKARSNGRSCPF